MKEESLCIVIGGTIVGCEMNGGLRELLMIIMLLLDCVSCVMM